MVHIARENFQGEKEEAKLWEAESESQKNPDKTQEIEKESD
ncbi:hypothetical protein LEP1GSC187_1632 [Leptospira santarosai str. ZUN179]|uniref:Uncharacterized protein n=1 Tax=Leptospira santarosai str. ZUN179 TaxID=1049985 RepID=M6UIY1_9LEPT|nr:hypothetical protein LEP1GSC039_0307 [Leptospira santarosai str. 2000027870]EMO45072.1 hypothetical protein LEP1GSC187_1632 [Leptospira santarosai str. ZUN179]